MEAIVEVWHRWFGDAPALLQALYAGLFTWGVTALGAGLVFFFSGVRRWFMDAMLGFAGGVMLAASFWSLLAPAIEMAEAAGTPGWIPAGAGFLMGSGFLYGADKVLPHLHIYGEADDAEGVSTTWHKSVLLVLAITLHNIPEGLAVGVGFGGASIGAAGASVGGAVALAIGIGLQNFPEGVAVSMPLRREGFSKWKAFLYGQASGVVEPIAAVAGCLFVISAQPILPYALSFAAGAMVYVVIEEVVPEVQQGDYADMSTLALVVGFVIMMTLDVALG